VKPVGPQLLFSGCRCPAHNCSNHGACSHIDGTCICTGNWTGTTCNQTRTVVPGSSTVVPGTGIVVSLDTRTSTAKSIPEDRSSGQPSVSTAIISPFSFSDNGRLVSQTVGPPMDQSCKTGPPKRTSSSTNWPYRYLLLGALLSLAVSITIHVLVCVKLRTCHHNNDESANTRLLSSRQGKQRRRKRKRTQIPLYSSSSDCSI